MSFATPIHFTLQAIKDKMTAQNTAISEELDSRIDTVESQVKKVVEDAKPVGTFTNAFDKCTADGHVLIPGKGCKEATIGETAHMGAVHWGGWSNSDGRDSGYVDGRFIKCTKKEDDTYIRVFYFDNHRTHGHNPHGRWNVMFCNANGDNCAHCADPGRIQNWRYGYHQRGLWSWDAMPTRTFGLCKKSENTDRNKIRQERILRDLQRIELKERKRGIRTAFKEKYGIGFTPKEVLR